ncbi:hypothetical protein Q4E93_13220 [Flavitalea sp. BT771]|uniref:hypothetical protein n=1 Tax=Flavitalea sp. BT771 TaxID=3063329 RepID=UPI0026E18C35|nr:hypothetical protein [Flavitalea sp. BT771]MDO6431559.1 hypothetical protein [Flavitalea sp. BT771]MDV6220467.1 hypothetical protein [Flavitalea sp. BT771]
MENASTNPHDQLLSTIKTTDISLRKRAVIIGVLTLVAWGLLQSYRISENKNFIYVVDVELLEQFKNSGTPKNFIEADSLEPLYDIIDKDAIYYKVAKSGYVDKDAIVEAITEVKNLRRSVQNDEKTIGILGLNAPFTPWLFISPFILLILFHDLSEQIFHRKSLLANIQTSAGGDWEKSIPFMGFHSYSRKDGESKFLQYISTLLVCAFLCCPLITCILLVDQVFGIDYAGHSKPNVFFRTWGYICTSIIATDTILIFYSENIIKFKYAVDLLSGKTGNTSTHMKNKMQNMRIWVGFFLLLLQSMVAAALGEASIDSIILYFTVILFCHTMLFLSMWKSNQYPTSTAWKTIRMWAIFTNLFLVFIAFRVLSLLKFLSSSNISGILSEWAVISLIAAVLAPLIYKKFIKEGSSTVYIGKLGKIMR